MPETLPGAIGISRLCVYDTLAPDGLVGGTPHMHLCCAEAYLVTAGTGAVQTLAWGGFARTELRPGSVVWFPPGTIHRLVNSGGLKMVVLMQNSGLPEAGDAVFTFPPDVLADPEAYAAAAALPDGGAPGPGGASSSDRDAAYQRRDLAVEGFRLLRTAYQQRGPSALDAFHSAAVALVAPRLDEWRKRWLTGALAAAEATGAQLDALVRGDRSHLRDGGVFALAEPSERGRLGMCGLLDTYRVDRV
jgi:mannose-6-phosphate isomerase-like protein (cupin superfamily)